MSDYDLAATARELIRSARTAVLSTTLKGPEVLPGWPYGSLVQCATSMRGEPVLLLSSLAVHTRNLALNPGASLLFDASAASAQPLTAARLSLLGTVTPSDAGQINADRARYLARYPEAAGFADFADFSFYRMRPDRGHLVAGFGQIQWLAAETMLLAPADCTAIQQAEAGIIAHMNQDHAQTIALYAEKLLSQKPGAWRVCGCDPDGIDLTLNGQIARLTFAARMRDATDIRRELMRLADVARS